jgi:hypothetical protein
MQKGTVMMDTTEFDSLLPKEKSSAAYAESINKIEAFKVDLSVRLESLRESRADHILQGLHQQAKQLAAKINELAALLEDADALLSVLRADILAEQHYERIEPLRKTLAEIDYEGKFEAFKQKWEREYPTLAAALAALLQEEQELLEFRDQANGIIDRLKSLGEDHNGFGYPAWKIAGARLSERSFGAMARLPGVRGSPHIMPIAGTETVVTQSPVYRDSDSQSGVWHPDHPHLGRIQIGTEEKAITNHIQIMPIEDVAFWWPKKRVSR